MANMIEFGQTESSGSLKGPTVSNSVHDYLSYSKKMQLRLAQINNNVSSVIQESCSGIDNICNRVRECLNEMDHRENKVVNCEVAEKLDNAEDLADTLDETSEIEVFAEAVQSDETTCYTMAEVTDQENTVNTEETMPKQILHKTIYSLKNEEESPTQTETTEKAEEAHFETFKNTINTLCDNFEMMNQLVESINQEITEFSETALPDRDKTEESTTKQSQPRKVKKVKTKAKAAKHATTEENPTKDVQGDCCPSYSELDASESVRNTSVSLLPDVYRKRAFTNLYQKLKAQVEASDSLTFFKGLMQRQKRLRRTRHMTVSQCKLNIPILNYSIQAESVLDAVPKGGALPTTKSEAAQPPPSKINLEEKYAGSLWFSPKHILKEGSAKTTSRKRRTKQKKPPNAMSSLVQGKKAGVSDSANDFVQAKLKPAHFKSVDNVTKRTCSLECTCKLVVQNDAPISHTNNKCQLQWLRTRGARRRLKFIDMLDDLTNRDLLPLQSEYPRRDTQKARELEYKNIKETYLYKLLYGAEGTKRTWQHLLEPTLKYPVNNIKPTPTPASRNSKDDPASDNFMKKFCKQNSKTRVIKKLSPYICDPEKQKHNYGKTVIVMPVRVFYDNFRNNEPPTKLKSNSKLSSNSQRKVSISPSSEFKSPKITKPVKVVFDGLLNKSELLSPISESPGRQVSSKPVISSARLCREKSSINSSRLSSEKGSGKMVISKSLSPKSFVPYCFDMKNYRKQNLDVRGEPSVAIYNKIQTDIETIKHEIYGKKYSKTERKLWENKYGKSVGQQLITFVQNQKPQAMLPVPRYAKPQLDIKPEQLQAAPITNTVGCDENPLKETDSQNQILPYNDNNQVTKNEAMQSNIRKAIDTIEARMVDILCNNTNSVDAFDTMEKEITHILNMMKCKGQIDEPTCSFDKGKTLTNIDEYKSLEETYHIISDNLFERLEKILSTESTSSNNVPKNVAPIEPKIEKEKDEVKKKQKVPTVRKAKHDVSSPSTSTSLEEKGIPKRSPRNLKKPGRVDAKSKQKNVRPILSKNKKTVEPIPEENVITTDQQPVKSKKSVKWKPVENSDIVNTRENDTKALAKKKSKLNTDNVISDDKVEKLEEISEPCTENIDKYKSIINSGIEQFINNKLNKVMKSIATYSQETPNMKTQDKPEIDVYQRLKNWKMDDFTSDECNKLVDSISKDEKTETTENQSKADESGLNIKSEMEEIKKVITLVDSDKEKPLETLLSEQIDDTTDFMSIPMNDSDEMATVNDVTDKQAEEIIGMENSELNCDLEDFTYEMVGEKVHQLDYMDLANDKKDDNTANYNETSTSETSDMDNLQVHCQDGYSQQVHTVIKRVEDIYFQLDEMHSTENLQNIPIFKQTDVCDVRSEVFLTPFMQVVKETREGKKNTDKTTLEKSPSYYNVMNFLDALSCMQKEVAYEIYTAHVHYYTLIFYEPTIYYLSEMWHEAKYSGASRISCLKKFPEDKQIKPKKVSFLEVKRDQSSQLTLCPFHKMKVVRISSQQFPPTDEIEEIIARLHMPEKGDHSTKGKNEKQETKPSAEPEATTASDALQDVNKRIILKEDSVQSTNLDEKNMESARIHNNTKETNTETKNVSLSTKTPQNLNEDDYTTDEDKTTATGDKSKSTSEAYLLTSDITTDNNNATCPSGGGCEKTKKPKLSVVDDKSTQVFCQMQNSQNLSDCVVPEEHVCQVSKESDTPLCIENTVDSNKSNEKDLFDDSSTTDLFYDYTKENITQKGVMQKIEEVYNEDMPTQPTVVVFREVLEERKKIPQKSNLNTFEMYKKLEKRKVSRQLSREDGNEIVKHQAVHEDNENVVLLKSFYAIVYILMFTALSLDYRCL